MVHAFSIGAYFYTLLMMEMAKNRDEWGDVERKIVAQVFDSLVAGGVDRMVSGIAGASQNNIAEFCIKATINSYFYATKKYTVDFYDKTVHHFTHEALQVPSLFLYCNSDPMAPHDVISELIETWRKRGDAQEGTFPVIGKCWPTSRHVGHLKTHPEEYVETLHGFLNEAVKVLPKRKEILKSLL